MEQMRATFLLTQRRTEMVLSMNRTGPLAPSPALLVKIGSGLVHAEEFFSSDGYPLDRDAFNSILSDVEVVEWLAEMNNLLLIPLKRCQSG